MTDDEGDDANTRTASSETLQSMIDDVNLEGFYLKGIINYSYENGYLYLLCELKTGEHLPISFEQLKAEHPHETALCVKKYVIGKTRGDYHQKWATNTLKHRRRNVRRMNRTKGVDKACRIHVRRLKNSKVPSRNSRCSSRPMGEKHGIKVPNSTKETLLLDKINGDSKWHDAMQKELKSLESLGVWKFHHRHHKILSKCQRAPLRMMFDVKKEDLRRKARLVVGSHRTDASHQESFSSVVQSMSLRVLLTMAKEKQNNFKIMSGGAGNAFSRAPAMEKVCAVAGEEFGEH